MEREVRRKNLIIHDVKDVKEERVDLELTVFHFIGDKLGIKLGNFELDFARRIGAYGGIKNGPIVIVNGTFWRGKIDILRKKNTATRYGDTDHR